MTIPASGPVTFTDIQTEFGGSNPIGLNEYYAGGANVPAGTSGTYGAVPSSGTISVRNFYGTSDVTPAGQVAYTTAGTYSWVCPTGVTSVSVVCVGGGGGPRTSGYNQGAGGGGLGYKNNYSVTAGSSYTVVVGVGGTPGNDGEQSYFVSSGVVRGGGGTRAGNGLGQGGTYTGDGGGNGGQGGAYGGGGGAGGYAGNGGAGSNYQNGSGGAGGGAGQDGGLGGGAAGGGVGLLGQGSDGTGGNPASAGSGYGNATGGGGGSGGTAGQNEALAGSNGGTYGGGAGNKVQYFLPTPPYNPNTTTVTAVGGSGAVRIIWAGGTGITRTFPSTNTGDL